MNDKMFLESQNDNLPQKIVLDIPNCICHYQEQFVNNSFYEVQ